MSLFNTIISLDELLVFADTLNIAPDSDDLEAELEAIYEWEYKYHAIKNSEKTHPKRKENLLERIEREITQVIFSATDKIEDVYNTWLQSHNIEDPREWAESRIYFYDEPVQNILTNALYQYKIFFDASTEQAYSAFIHANYGELLPQIENLFNLKKIELQEEIKQETAEEEPNENEITFYTDRLNELNNYTYLDNFTTGMDFLEEYDLVEDLVLLSIYEEDPEELLINFYVEKLFEGWYMEWSARGLEDTIENIKEVYNELQNMSGKSLSEKFTIFNRALNTAHQNGSMMEYITDANDVTYNILDQLSNSENVHQWNKDLKMMGIR